MSKSAGSSMTKNGGGLVDYIDKMIGVGMGGQGAPSSVPQTPAQPAGPSVFPTPRPQERIDQDELDRALERGISWEEIAAGGILGAGATLLARQVLSRMNKTNAPAGDTTWMPDNGGVGQGPKTVARPSVQPNQQQDILTRNGLIEGQPSNNPDIDAQFYEIFGLPKPVRPDMEPRLTPYEGGGPTSARETYVPPMQNSSIPGPNQRAKQLGDADSPTYRENFGYNDIDRRAQDIVDRMEMYGDYDISKYMDPSSEPAVARQVGNILRNMM
jgi:hypothetical protein